jgi:hypothetical protein
VVRPPGRHGGSWDERALSRLTLVGRQRSS